MGVTKSWPLVFDFMVVTKKSIVLYCGGFHLNECFQVVLLEGLGFPILSVPTPILAGVNMSPSVLYSNSPCTSFPKMKLHASNILSVGTDG